MIGPAQVSRAVEPLRKTGTALLASDGKAGPLAELGRLGRNLGRAAGGVAAAARRALAGDLRRGPARRGLRQGRDGRARDRRAASPGRRRQPAGGRTPSTNSPTAPASSPSAQRRAALGALPLKLNLPDIVHEPPPQRPAALAQDAEIARRGRQRQRCRELMRAAQAADEQLKAALQQLQAMTVGKTDPNYAAGARSRAQASAAVSGTDPVSGQPYAPEYTGLPAELTALQTRLLETPKKPRKSPRWIGSRNRPIEATRLGRQTPLRRAATDPSGGKQARPRRRRLAQARSSWPTASAGSAPAPAALAGGIAQLTGGTTALEESLADGLPPLLPAAGRPAPRHRAGARRQTQALNRRLDRVRRTTPGIFDSGYFVLSALDGTRGRGCANGPPKRSTSNGGGQAATLLVISRYALQLAGLDRAQQAPRRRRRGARQGSGRRPPASPAAPPPSTPTAT